MLKHLSLVIFVFFGVGAFANNSNKIFNQKLIDRILADNANSIVSISSEKFDTDKNEYREIHRGTGIVIDSSGLILTAYHTVKHNPHYVLFLKNGLRIPSTRIIFDESMDLALFDPQDGKI